MTSKTVQGRMTSGSPKTLALLYRIWAYASPRGWNVTVSDISEAINEPSRRISINLVRAGWSQRVRSSAVDSYESYPSALRVAHAIAHDLGAMPERELH